MLYYARRVPSVPLARVMTLGATAARRATAQPRPSWTALFIRAFALAAQRHPSLRQAFIPWPVPHLYEHAHSICALVTEREWHGQPALLGGLIRGPESQSLCEIDACVKRYATAPVESIGYFRQALRVGGYPLPVRRFLWWVSLNWSGYKRAKRLGTFMVSSIGKLGIEQMHPLSPLTALLTFGPVSPQGEVVVKVVYDHRVLDGATAGRFMLDLESTLQGQIADELAALQPGIDRAA
jgi:hypothetical protein